MDSNTDKNLFYFLHIPKTAGTSLVNILENQFTFGKIYDKVIWPELFKDFPLDLNSYNLIRGHFGYWICDLLPRKPKIITMIRTPLEQILSLYEHQRRAFDEDEFSMLKSKDEPILEVLKDGPRRNRLANHQTRNLTLEINKEEFIKILNQNHKIEENNFKQLRPRLPKLQGKELLDLAKKRLESFEFIGITEKFEQSLQLMYFTFGWYPIQYVPKENVASTRVTFDSYDGEIQKELRKATRLDTELYKFANEIFDSRFSQMVDLLNKKYYDPRYVKMSENNVIYEMLERHYASLNEISNSHQSTNLIFDVKDEMIGYGWHQRELWSDKNKVIRWSGPETNSVLFFSLEDGKNIEFEIFIMSSTFDLDKLEIKVNDHPVSFDLIEKLNENLMNKFTGRKPGAIIKGEFSSDIIKGDSLTQLTFINKKTTSFKELNRISKDSRKIGFALEKIILKETI